MERFRFTYTPVPLSRPRSNINKVDATMESIREQMDLSNEISDAISNPVNMGIEVDDVSGTRKRSLHDASTSSGATRLILLVSIGRTKERVGRIGAGTVERAVGWCRASTGTCAHQRGTFSSIASTR